eukprot:148392_1
MQNINNYPCGHVEEFVLCSNRRKLLQVETDNEATDDEKRAVNGPSSSILYGSHHAYYHLLQIENEITAILFNCNDLNTLAKSDISKLKSLLVEANDIILKYKQNNNSNNIEVMTFRHKLRKLFLSPYIQMETETNEMDDIFDMLINKLGVKFNHSKPNDIITSNNKCENDEKISSMLNEFDLKTEFNRLFDQCTDFIDIKKYFTASCLPLLIQQHY